MVYELEKYVNVINSELFRVGPVVVFIWENKENWPILIVSENIERIYGHNRDDFLSDSLQYASLIHSEDASRVFQEVTVASKFNDTSFEHKPYRLKCKNGDYKWIQDTTQIIRNSNGDITHYVGYITNISELKELENEYALQNSELLKSTAFLQSYKLAIDESSILSRSDLNGNITYVNDNFCKVSGYSKEEIVGKPHSFLRHYSSKKETFEDLWKTIKSKKVWKGVLQNRGKNSDYWVDISILPILDENSEITEYVAVRHDITKMVLQKERLDSAANTDTLTGYGNRYKLNNDIQTSTKPALAILNIDGFSQINDFYGHQKGDRVIKELGVVIENIIQHLNCELYHLQGDEYVVFNKKTSKSGFLQKIKTITSQVATASILLDEDEIFLNLSTAISFEDKSKLMQTADMALKVAKKENKNIVVYSDTISLNDEYENNMIWSKKIKKAIEDDNIVPVFQPIVNNNNSAFEKYESLVRLKDDDKLITPYFFLEISKKSKHYTKITKIMIEKSFEMFKDKDVEFSVNLTIEDILNEDIKKYIYIMLNLYKIGSKVVFEIVESESIENFDEIAIFIEKIKSYGCKIAIDDFGTGYSNFEYLMKIKADFIKIDGSIIKNIVTSYEAQMVVSVVVDFAKKMNMKTIAEFVEDDAILTKVKEFGIDYSQGYHFGKPSVSLL
ncbi:MAG: EAL domain-containing protein [Campylobacterota bacterium]|nr:EAL domain-containing protein [Campylobacterota bacterium]